MEDKKKIGLIVTAVTAFLCGCPGLCGLIFGILTATNSDLVTTTGNYEALGIGMVCLGLLMTLIPVGAGIYTFLQSKNEGTAEEIEEVPPAI